LKKKRFNTRFFLAKLPPGPNAFSRCDGTHGISLGNAAKGVGNASSERNYLNASHLKTIEELSAFRNIDELFSAAKTKIIYPILPQLTGNSLKLPHDPEIQY